MAKGRLRVLSTIPGPTNLGPIVREFCRKEGVITAFSDSAIKMLASLLPEDSGSDVLAFGSLARRFATFCGEMPLPVAHQGHAVAAIASACEDLSHESPFFRSARRPGLHKGIVATLHELSEYGLDPDAYEAAAQVCDPILAPKLRSLGELEADATGTLRQLGRSFSREHYRICLQSVPEEGADLGSVLVLAGSLFSPQSIELLKWAVAHGANVTVVVYRHAQGADLFRGASRTVNALGVEPELIGIGHELLEHLFVETAGRSDRLNCSIVSAADPLAEAEWALRGCLERRQQGMPYDRMALYVRDSTSYAPLIEASAKRLGVPIRMWRRAPLLTNSFARLTQAALRFCASNDVRTLIPVARTSYFGLDSVAREELMVGMKAAHSTRSHQWTSLRNWVAECKLKTENGNRYDWLEKLLEWREDSIGSSCTLEVWIGKLRELILILPLESGPLAGRERDKRAGYVLHQSLNQIGSVRRLTGPRSLTLAEFCRTAGEVWEESDVSIPSLESAGVLVTSQADSLPGLRCLFVLGMLEGVFPRRRTEDPVLSDFDRIAISELRQGEQLPLSRDKADAERDEFYTVCAAATEEIVLSYPETDEERDNVPAFYLDEVSRALGGVARISRSRQELTPPLVECVAASDREICAALDSQERTEPLPLEFSNPFTAAAFTRNPDQGLSPRELREGLQCPFSYFAKRTLKLRPDRLRARWFSLVQLPKAGMLSAKDTPEAAYESLGNALDARLDELFSEVPDWEISLLRSGGHRLIREWVEREFAARKLWPKENVRSEVAFGEEGLRSVLPKIAKLSGSVAGTSRCGPYPVVHLVETSGPTKSYGAANELVDQDKLYYGVHLLAAWDRGAAALEIETMAGERFLILLPRLAGVNLPAKVQDGLRVIDLGGSEDAGGARAFFDGVKKLAQESADRIAAVDVRAIKGEHCAWCDYGELCRRSFEFGEEDSPFAVDL